jgi:polygalacturonase
MPYKINYHAFVTVRTFLYASIFALSLTGCSGAGSDKPTASTEVSPTQATTDISTQVDASDLDLKYTSAEMQRVSTIDDDQLLAKHAESRVHGVSSENIIFPTDAGVINLKEAPYNAVGDGVHDDTVAIQMALDANPNRRAILYLPNGTYLVSSPLKFPTGPYIYGLVNLQGQSTRGTIIKLKANVATDLTSPKAVITCGAHGSADYFSNSIRNLTVDTGIGNPSAIGIQFFSNNMGSVRNVDIVSGDRQGLSGLDLSYNDQNGPLLVKNLKVVGFQYGVKTGNLVNSQTFENIALSNQSVTGFYNGGQVVSIRGLESINTVSTIYNAGVMTLVDASLIGYKTTDSAINSTAVLFARNVITPGYKSAIENTGGDKNNATGPYVSEFVSQAVISQYAGGKKSLNLLIKETPQVPWDPLSEWANVVSFGADPTGSVDSTAAIQAAIDSGKSTVYLPRGDYKITATIMLRNKVRRIIGTQSYVDVPASVNPGFKLVDGTLFPPVVVFERIDSGYAATPTLENASSRTLVIKDGTNLSGNMTGSGNVFIENVTSNPNSSWIFGKQNVWARQINPENEGTKITNNGGSLWILGLKTERGGTLIDTRAGGETELLGGLSYTTTDPNTRPMFITKDSFISTTLAEISFAGTPFRNLVEETRGDTTKTLVAGPNVPSWIGGGSALPLYTGYPCDWVRRSGYRWYSTRACP